MSKILVPKTSSFKVGSCFLEGPFFDQVFLVCIWSASPCAQRLIGSQAYKSGRHIVIPDFLSQFGTTLFYPAKDEWWPKSGECALINPPSFKGGAKFYNMCITKKSLENFPLSWHIKARNSFCPFSYLCCGKWPFFTWKFARRYTMPGMLRKPYGNLFWLDFEHFYCVLRAKSIWR